MTTGPTDPRQHPASLNRRGDTGDFARLRALVLRVQAGDPLYSHVDCPALIMTASGTVTEYRSSCKVPIVHTGGEVAQESGGISHWWKNTGNAVAVLY